MKSYNWRRQFFQPTSVDGIFLGKTKYESISSNKNKSFFPCIGKTVGSSIAGTRCRSVVLVISVLVTHPGRKHSSWSRHITVYLRTSCTIKLARCNIGVWHPHTPPTSMALNTCQRSTWGSINVEISTEHVFNEGHVTFSCVQLITTFAQK